LSVGGEVVLLGFVVKLLRATVEDVFAAHGQLHRVAQPVAHAQVGDKRRVDFSSRVGDTWFRPVTPV
jgi:hypothetical protein